MSKAETLSINHPAVKHLCEKDKRLAKVVRMVGPIQIHLHTENMYAFLVHEIVEQMLSIKAGQVIYDRLLKLCNGSVEPEIVARLTKEEIISIGVSKSKAQSIISLTNAIIEGSLNLSDFKTMNDNEVIKTLTNIHGIGNWTAKMFLLFVLGRPDVLPFEDGAFLQTYRWLYKTSDCSAKSVIKKCQKWKPYSSVAARYFYRALDMGLTKKDFHLFKEEL